MLEFTLAELERAFEAVRANRGCAGVDGVTIGAFGRNLGQNLQALRHELQSEGYRPLPLLKILVAKKNGEPRPLCIPCVRDRVAQKAILSRIEPKLEAEFEDCSFAYRKGRSIRQVVEKIRLLYNAGYRWVVDADIDQFFDNVDHDLLMEKFLAVVDDAAIAGLVRNWLAAPVWDGERLEPLERGIPQGSALSPIMANLFLDELDEAMLAAGFAYIRYADDFVVLCKSKDMARGALRLSKEILRGMLLELDEEEVTSFANGFKYLGVIFINSLIMKPFETRKAPRKVLYYPPPLDMSLYRSKVEGGC